MSKFSAGAGKALALAVLAGAVAAPAATADELHQSQGLRKALTSDGVREHLVALQSHADANGGERTGGSPGFEASASYVADRARAAGYVVRDHWFNFNYNIDRTPPALRAVTPTPKDYAAGRDFSTMSYSASVPETTAPVWAVDLKLPQAPGPGATTSGCEAADFAGFPAGAIALVQRGTCPFATKSLNARAVGAVATIVFNDGGDAGRVGVINGTLSNPGQGAAIGTTLAVGQELARGVADGDTGSTATIKIDRLDEVRATRNVIAESPGGNPDDVVVVGAHLDSVPRGPGINDNGSGSGGILEIAETLAARGFDPRNKLRFMWYSAEEFGLVGSTRYVASLPDSERAQIKAMLNFDMIGSPNYVRFVYDGDNSAFPVGPGSADGPQGSGEIERIFHDYFRGVGLASDETPFSGRSDYGPFIARGIPAGGLFTGAEGVKTEAQARIFGGTAGVPYDVCYHLTCDDLSNVNMRGLGEMLDAAGHATLTLAKRDLAKDPLVDPVGPVRGSGGTTDAGGGLHADHDHEVEAG